MDDISVRSDSSRTLFNEPRHSVDTIDKTLDEIMAKIENRISNFDDSLESSNIGPIIEDTRLTCVGQELTIIPAWWGDMYGEFITHIDLSFNQLETAENLDKFQCLDTLVLDNNSLGENLRFAKIPTLKTLCLNNNNVQEIDNFLSAISTCFPNLEYLSFLKNPACYNDLMGGSEEDYKKYRTKVISMLKHLKFLDSRPVTKEERHETSESWELVESKSSTSSTDTLAVPTTTAPSVISTETRKEDKYSNKIFTVYQVTMVNSQGKKCSVYRRYNDFYQLHQQLLKQYPKEKLPFFPPKRLIGDNFDPQFIEFRRKKLHEYIRTILLNKEMRESNALKQFLSNDLLLTKSDERALGGERSKVSLDDFILLRVIGKGSFGKVMLAQFKSDGRLYALKVLSKKKIKQHNEVEHIKSEREVLMSNTKHPFLVGLRYSFQTKEKLYFVLDYVSGGELFFHLQKSKRFSEELTRFYASEILLAIEYLHQYNIVYRDLKPENVLLHPNGHISLTDFGLCKVIEKTTKTFCGTPEYLAPEVLRKQEYGLAVDWWCFGCVIYEMLVGLPPFYCHDYNEMYSKILNSEIRFPHHVSELARDLILHLLDRNANTRLGSSKEDANEVKRHPFFNGVDWKKVYNREVIPPFMPPVDNEMDLRNFDKHFTDEPIPQSILNEGKFQVDVEIDDAFSGFSYAD